MLEALMIGVRILEFMGLGFRVGINGDSIPASPHSLDKVEYDRPRP